MYSHTTGCGGVVQLTGGSSLTSTTSTFAGNSASAGGVVCAQDSDSVDMTSCSFVGNSAVDDGGVVLAAGVTSLSLSHCIGSQSHAGGSGGFLAVEPSSSASSLTADANQTVVLVDSVVTGSSAGSGNGGAVYWAADGDSDLVIVGSTLQGTAPHGGGGAVYNSGGLHSSNSIQLGTIYSELSLSSLTLTSSSTTSAAEVNGTSVGNSFADSTALYGATVASSPVYIVAGCPGDDSTNMATRSNSSSDGCFADLSSDDLTSMPFTLLDQYLQPIPANASAVVCSLQLNDSTVAVLGTSSGLQSGAPDDASECCW